MIRYIISGTILIWQILIISCSENLSTGNNDLPEVITSDVTTITSTTAKTGGKIISDGSLSITNYGIIYSTNSDFDKHVKVSADSLLKDSFLVNISNLIPSTSYYVNAYATNISGSGYGNSKSFTTLDSNDNIVKIDTTGIVGFENKLTLTTGTTPYYVYGADFDNDGDNDIAVANYGSANVTVFLNYGKETFSTGINYNSESEPTQLVKSFNSEFHILPVDGSEIIA